MVSNILYVHPYLGNDPIWPIFLRWDETTNVDEQDSGKENPSRYQEDCLAYVFHVNPANLEWRKESKEALQN